jgi:hypothetical protein
MESYCFSRHELKEVIEKYIFDKEIKNNSIMQIIERASIDWDLNVIASSYSLSIIIEQIMKKEDFLPDYLSIIYELQNSMFFTIDELNRDIIEELFLYHLPNKRNNYIRMLNEAKRGNNNFQVRYIENLLSESFEEDLYSIIRLYYETKVHY